MDPDHNATLPSTHLITDVDASEDEPSPALLATPIPPIQYLNPLLHVVLMRAVLCITSGL
jgi:hypothetical protein